jgi:hypothetical protein
MIKTVFYRILYVLLWTLLILDAFLVVVYPISILITVGVTILLFPFILMLLFCQYCLASVLIASEFSTNANTLALLRGTKFVTSGFGLIKSVWVYLAIILALSLGMYFLFKNKHSVPKPVASEVLAPDDLQESLAVSRHFALAHAGQV